MDVTPIVEVLQAMPAGPTINVTINIDPTLEGDLNILSPDEFNMPLGRDAFAFGDLNAPFGKDFLDITENNDHSTTTNLPGASSSEDKSPLDSVDNAQVSVFPESPSLPILF